MATKEEEKISTLLEDLTSLESYARDLFSFLPLPLCLVSSTGIILEVNPAFENITGYNTEEIIGKPIEDIFIKKEFEEANKETLEKGFIKAKELIIFTKEKKEVPASISTILRKSEEGEIIGYFVGLFDLSSIKETEKDLKNAQAALLNMLEDVEEARGKAEEEKNKTMAIINNFTDGLLVFGPENKLSLINPQVEKIFDIKQKDIINRTIQELKTFPTIEPLSLILLKEIKDIFRREIKLKENLIIEISSTPILRGKEKLGNLIILHDITREKLIEKMKTEFVSISAHQLRTPLSAIKWTLRMLLDGDLGEITLEQRDFLEKTYRSNEKMINLINSLLDITRIEEGRYVYKPVLTEITPICQFVIKSYEDEIKRKNIKLDFKKPEKRLPKINMDVEKIKLAIQNLLDNAIRYTPPGGKVTIDLKHGKKEVEFSIKDSGVGIPKDQQSRIFTRFFRGANVMRMDTEGSGLGLYIVKNIIEAHGGRVWFESEEGKGTTFYFNLPVKEEFAEFLKEF
jgi:PAS domain S-box-containing protein